MADSFIQVAPDSTGKKLQTAENTIGGNDVHAEAVVLVGPDGVPLPTSELNALFVQLFGYDYNLSVPRRVQTDGVGKLILSGDTQIPVVLGSGISGPAQIEDVASGDSDRGVAAMAIRKATPANTSDTDGDYEMLQMDGGKLWVKGDLSLPTGAATEAKQDTQITDLGGVTETAPASDTASSGLNGRLQRIAQRLTSLIALLPSSLGGKTAANSFSVTTATDDPELTLIGGVTETAPATDTASSGLNGRLQRIAQRITSLIALFPTSIGQKTKATSLGVTLASDEDTIEVSGSVELAAASASLLTNIVQELTFTARTGSLTETAPASDTASSGLNGRLQRIAQRITSLIALIPASLGQKTKANSFAVTLASDSDTLPVSAASLPLPTGASTAAKQPALGTALAPSTDVLTTQRPAVTQVVSTAFEASHVLKASAGQLVQLSIFNSGPAQFILLINSTTVPANGAVTLLYPPIPIAAATLLVLDLPAPLVASTGIAVCNSSTGTFTKTLGSADLAIYAQVN